jgi:hypothetical protein
MEIRTRICAFLAAVVFFCSFAGRSAQARSAETFSQAGVQATATLLDVFYTGAGSWRNCDRNSCSQANSDWGADSATDALFLRWRVTGDPKIRGVMSQLLATAPHYPDPCARSCPAWSDTPSWDAVTLMREYEVLDRDPRALALAESALRYVEQSTTFQGGVCSGIPYQLPRPSASPIKTLETDANATKAALLIYRATGDRVYLQDALARYAADRKYYLDPQVPLYTVHVIDDGTTCTQVARRFFASVNGDMIWNGLELWRVTGQQHFYDEALATAQAVNADLSDGRGVFVDLQGENDVVEPLVEAMYDLATQEHLPFAREWIVANAGAALSSRAPDGAFSRFFDGPSQQFSSVWECNGGLALEIAAAGLDPNGTAPDQNVWSAGQALPDAVTRLPATIVFDGSGIALVGTISELCTSAHVRVFIDGTETFDRTGLWQNPSMPSGDSVLFAWRWLKPGQHTLQLEPADPSEAVPGAVHLQGVVLAEPVPEQTAAGE